jgi:tetratricopeptide (TPR) repeat protein
MSSSLPPPQKYIMYALNTVCICHSVHRPKQLEMSLRPAESEGELFTFILSQSVCNTGTYSCYSQLLLHFNHAIRLKPKYSKAYNYRGLAKSDLNDKKGAIDDYTHAIRLKPNYAVAYNYRGLAKLKSDLNDLKSAIDDYTHVIRIDPKYAVAYNYRGLASLL